MKNYLIREEIIRALVSYLAQRPYAEVHQIIQVLTSLKEAKEDNCGGCMKEAREDNSGDGD